MPGMHIRMDKRNNMTKKYALISVYDKTGIVDLARIIAKSGYLIISTGGTSKVLIENNIPVIPIQNITGNPESFDGRMKTISFQIESGILFDRKKPSHQKEAKNLQIPQIDIVVCNLYPFEKTIGNPKAKFNDIIENIDVGGPTMIRSAAKNHYNVIVIVDPGDYPQVGDLILRKHLSTKLRQNLAAKAFAHLSYYDAQIARYLSDVMFPQELTIPLKLSRSLRYGDNPDQKSNFYAIPNSKSPIENIVQLAGRGLSATNLTDIDIGIKALQLFKEPAAVIIKHNNPCGIALGKNISVALVRALDADSESAFGGVVVLNRLMTLRAAKVIAAFKQSGKGQMDIIAVPEFEPEAVELLKNIRRTTGLYTFPDFSKIPIDAMSIKLVNGGAVIQTTNYPEASFDNWQVLTKIKPTKIQLKQMQIAWKFISRIKSNTVAVIDKILPMTRGIGSGQTSRILATKIALERASKFAHGAILASDSFFPFDDSVKLAARAGISAIVEQGGSIRDQDSIDAANKAGITMVFTGQRVFWH
jgi:phosphoribosylaminoimidazolecarboxamide formyltransferase / IMP cyclohydrolase